MQRAFLYGDLLFESMLGEEGNIPHIARHFRRLEASARTLYLDLCGLNEEKFKEESLHALRAFMLSGIAAPRYRVRFVLNRKSNGLYLPDKNDSEYEIQVEPLQAHFSETPLNLGVFNMQQKAPGPLSNLKNGNALIYIMARIWAREKGFEDALIENTSGEIIEASSSNIFWQKNQQWYTPPLSSGCVAGIGRELFMEKHPVSEKPCFTKDLQQADACVLTNALVPIRYFKVL